MPKFDDNPYASPLAEDQPGDEPAWDAYSIGDEIVTLPKSELPSRCFACNAPGTRRHVLRKTGWVSVAGVVNISIEWRLCDLHHRRQTAFRVVSQLGVMLAMIVGPFIVFSQRIDPLISFLGVSAMALAASLLPRMAGAWAGRTPSIKHAGPTQVRIGGAGPEYLASLRREKHAPQ